MITYVLYVVFISVKEYIKHVWHELLMLYVIHETFLIEEREYNMKIPSNL
jgi:hypothetical protein